MHLKLKRPLLLISSIIYFTFLNNIAPYVLSENGNSASVACRNPNGNSGLCVSIHQCESLKTVLTQRIECYYKFLRLSQCDCEYESIESSPCVCCTADNHFTKEARAHRIVFPGFNNEQRCNESVEVSKEETVTEASSTLEHELDKFPKLPNCGVITIGSRIYGGEEAELTEFSWMVNLEYMTATRELVSVCAGSLINERYILTAAHCIVGKIEQKVGKVVSLRLGEHNTATDIDCNADRSYCTAPSQRFGIESIVVHPNFVPGQQYGIHQHHDIALIRMNRRVTFSDSIQPVCLPSVEPEQKIFAGTKLTVAGWGHNGSALRTFEKRKVKLPFVELEECRKFYAKKLYVADEQICAGGIFREDSCSGDSGGPLMRLSAGAWILEGIVSFGSGCGLEKPGIYTNVRSYLQWIEEQVTM